MRRFLTLSTTVTTSSVSCEPSGDSTVSHIIECVFGLTSWPSHCFNGRKKTIRSTLVWESNPAKYGIYLIVFKTDSAHRRCLFWNIGIDYQISLFHHSPKRLCVNVCSAFCLLISSANQHISLPHIHSYHVILSYTFSYTLCIWL